MCIWANKNAIQNSFTESSNNKILLVRNNYFLMCLPGNMANTQTEEAEPEVDKCKQRREG